MVDLLGSPMLIMAVRSYFAHFRVRGRELMGSGIMPKSLIDEICPEKSEEKAGKPFTS